MSDRMTSREQNDLQQAFERDKWAGEWNSLPTAIDRLLAQREEYHLAMHRAYRPEVVAAVAVHLGSHEDWQHLAEWCGGTIHNESDPSGEYSSFITLPNGEVGGDWAWLVLNHEGEFHFHTEVEAPLTYSDKENINE